MASNTEWLSPSKFRTAMRRLLSHHYLKFRKGKVLDIGTGLGLFGLKKSDNYFGIEPNKEAVEIMKKQGYNVEVGSGENLRFDDETFDTVTCFHVIEHTIKGKEIIKEAFRVLKNNGIFILVVPDFKAFQLHKEYGHLKFYSKEKCLNMLRETGFKIVKITSSIQPDIRRLVLAKEIVIICKKVDLKKK